MRPLFLFCLMIFFLSVTVIAQRHPNVVFIYADDLGYGDLSCYGATGIQTPHVDRLAAEGRRFTNANSTSATCTPSRFALMTGQYPWRRNGTGILPGDAALIIPTDSLTLPKLFKQAGYATGIVGKWHLGLGAEVNKNWNGEIKPGPLETGFDYAFIFPATADRVPTVFIENHRVSGLPPKDTIEVNYDHKVGNEPTGRENPELLKMKASPNHGHDNTIVNGIGRIGYMSGGKTARWTDEEMPLTFLAKAASFIKEHKEEPFFLYYSLTEPHVPRMPSTMFKGKSTMGFRGDAILQLDYAVGEITRLLESLHLEKNTIIIFTSDNGPVLDDGYQDDAVLKQNGHRPAGALRGGKYSSFEGGTRVPFIIRWQDNIPPGVSDALICQMDILASFSSLLRQGIPKGMSTDSENLWRTLSGKSSKGRTSLVKHAGTLSIVKDNWKYISPGNGPAYNSLTNIELGNNPRPQLYDLSKDIGEYQNLAEQYPGKLKELADLLKRIQQEN